ncbi:MAG: ATP-binding protein [Chlorobiaceae bacterium]|nr:ATP-binding protein [Chlorobiaceae bacterium]
MLDQIRPANAVWKPIKALVYGVQGIGKNTFAATFKNPVMIQIEDGSAALDIPAFPLSTTYLDVVNAIQALHGDHQYKTLIVDTLDWLEPLLWQACCEHHGKESIESFGYGKGYIEVDRWWQYIMTGLDSLRHNKGMDVIVLAHSEVKTITPPDSDSYDTYQIKMQKRAFALWQEWADLVLFLNYKVNIVKTKTGINEERTRGVGTGDRMIYTAERPAWRAKSRWPLPDEILIGKDKTFAAFHQQLEAATGGRYISPIPVTTTATATKTKEK